MSAEVATVPIRKLDHTNYKPVRKRLKSALDNAGGLVVDLSDCGYIDATGLGVLVTLSKQAREQGKSFWLHYPNADLRAVLELTKLDTYFNIRFARPEP